MGAKKRKQPRRTGPEARTAILDAAERRLLDVGPAGIRLQDVAADVGISHPAVLHHFGDREGLVHAVTERAIDKLEEELVGALAGDADGTPPDPGAMLQRVFDTLGERGHARLVAWLLLSGYRPFASERSRANWKKIAERTHESRMQLLGGIAKPPYEDTLFTLVMASLALFGEALAGPSVFMSAGLDADPEARKRYRAWFAGVIVQRLAGGG
ncbi:MAG: TetR/AcrR family transcriptional regulator [Deltaproteobacteria bacterium]|nr:TetR/AcrR family transcriptional regulator [Deltaproteobacteria bacterium]